MHGFGLDDFAVHRRRVAGLDALSLSNGSQRMIRRRRKALKAVFPAMR